MSNSTEGLTNTAADSAAAARASHTPGPWVVGKLDQNGQQIVRSEHIEICTCWHHCVVAIEEQMKANAVLIAAAPDLLTELERLVRALEVREETGFDFPGIATLNGARAAIKKARGE